MEINLVAILVTIVFNILKRLSSRIGQLFQSRDQKDILADIELMRADLVKLKKERDKFNPMDQFASFALVDRKVTKLTHEIQLKQGEIRARKLKVSIYVSGFMRVVDAIYHLLLIWYYRYTPIFDFATYPATDYGPEAHIVGNVYHITEHLSPMDGNSDQQWSLFSPISYILSFPSTNRCNSIGITFWLFLLNRIINIVIAKFNANTGGVVSQRPSEMVINTDIELD